MIRSRFEAFSSKNGVSAKMATSATGNAGDGNQAGGVRVEPKSDMDKVLLGRTKDLKELQVSRI